MIGILEYLAVNPLRLVAEVWRDLGPMELVADYFWHMALPVTALVIGGFYMFAAGDISMGAIIAIVMLAGRAMAPVGQFAFLITRARQVLQDLPAKICGRPVAGAFRQRGRARARPFLPVVMEPGDRLRQLGWSYNRSAFCGFID